jgi:hypothetical protein
MRGTAVTDQAVPATAHGHRRRGRRDGDWARRFAGAARAVPGSGVVGSVRLIDPCFTISESAASWPQAGPGPSPSGVPRAGCDSDPAWTRRTRDSRADGSSGYRDSVASLADIDYVRYARALRLTVMLGR